jgi:hypothetical protein
VLTSHKQQRPRAVTGCLYILRKEGERKVIHVKEDYIAEIVKLVEYVERKENQPMQIVRHANITQTQHCYCDGQSLLPFPAR